MAVGREDRAVREADVDLFAREISLEEELEVVRPGRRTGAADDFRSNLHRGGSAQLIKITPEERSTAVRAAKHMGLNVCGVDMLRSNHGPVIMEVNSSPGLEGIEKATEKDVAGTIIDYIAANAKAGKTKTKGKG